MDLLSRRRGRGKNKDHEKYEEDESANDECCDAQQRCTASGRGDGQSNHLYAVALGKTTRGGNQSQQGAQTKSAAG
jgi:hypothetical protein